MTQHEYNTRKYKTTQVKHDLTKVQRKLGSKDCALFFVTKLYIFLIFFLEIVNIVLRVILIKPFEYQGLIILLSKILSNQGHMTSSSKLSGLLLDTKPKIATQVPKMYMYPLLCVFSTITLASEN